MSLLISHKILDRIRSELSKTTNSFLIISAYSKLSLVEFLDSCCPTQVIEKKLVVRFRPDDILCGASDLELYPYCKRHGWRLYFRLDLHAKTYIFDNLRCIVGSANATGSGLNFSGTGNYEIAAACLLEPMDVKALELLLLGAVEMDDTIYNQMKAVLSNQKKSSSAVTWPKTITDLFVPDYSLLFTEDFPPCPHPYELSEENLFFLGLSSSASTEAIRHSFENSKSFCWLYSLVRSQDCQEMYFGAITAALHNALLNEPKPYRKEVKNLIGNLLNWIIDLDVTELQVDVPKHSQRVRYVPKVEYTAITMG